MVGVLTVSDFRESEGWSIARSVVCAILDITDSWSNTVKSKRFGKQMRRLSVTLLNEIAGGCEGLGNPALLAKAADTVHKLETELEKFRQEGMLDDPEFRLLGDNLKGVKLSLKHTQMQLPESN